MLRQRKVSKRKAIPEAYPLRGSPAFLVKPGARATRCAQTGRERPPALLRCSAAPDGWAKFKTTDKTQQPHTRLHSPSTAATPGSRCAPCLSDRAQRVASCARPDWRGTQGIGVADECSRAALLFGYFLLGTQEKVPRPSGRNKCIKQPPTNKHNPGSKNRHLRKHPSPHTIPPCNHSRTIDSSAPCYANR